MTHARGFFCGPVVEVQADVLLGGQVEPEPREGLEADRDRALLRVRVGERRQPSQVGDMWSDDGSASRSSPRMRSSQRSRSGPNELVLLARRSAERVGERMDVDRLASRAAADRVGVAREVRLERLAAAASARGGRR